MEKSLWGNWNTAAANSCINENQSSRKEQASDIFGSSLFYANLLASSNTQRETKQHTVGELTKAGGKDKNIDNCSLSDQTTL